MATFRPLPLPLRTRGRLRIGATCRPAAAPVLAAGLLASTCGATGCGDFRSPADLLYPQILAVRLEPPELRPGESARIDVLTTDEIGVAPSVPFETRPTKVEFAPGPSGQALPLPPEAMAFLAREGDDFVVRAPPRETLDAIAAALGLAPDAALRVLVRVTVDLGGIARRADKLVTVLRAPDVAPTVNPRVRNIFIDDEIASPDTHRTLTPGDHRLDVETDENPHPLSFAWYAAQGEDSKQGEVERYRSKTALLKAKKPGEGILLVVVRNDHGGVGWHSVKISVVAP